MTSAVRCYDQTRDLSSVNFYIFLPNLGLHESTVGVALGSHIAERKRVRAHGVRKSVFYSIPAELPSWVSDEENKIEFMFTNDVVVRCSFTSIQVACKQPVSLPTGRAVADSSSGVPHSACSEVLVAPSKHPRDENREVTSVHFA